MKIGQDEEFSQTRTSSGFAIATTSVMYFCLSKTDIFRFRMTKTKARNAHKANLHGQTEGATLLFNNFVK
jgi:hypothetical protein